MNGPEPGLARACGPKARERADTTDKTCGERYEQGADKDQYERAENEDAGRAAREQLVRRCGDTRLPESEREHQDEKRGDDRERSERCQADLPSLPSLAAPKLAHDRGPSEGHRALAQEW